jgi:N-acetylmuramoyl-L-alanine amidase
MKVELNYREAGQAVDRARVLMAELSGKPIPKKTAQPASNEKPDKSLPPASNEKTDKNSPPTSQPNKSNQPPKSAGTDGQKEAPPPAKGKAPTPPKARPTPSPPAPRADGLAQIYALYLDDQGSFSEITAYLDRVTPYLYNLIPPSREGGNFRVYVDFKETRLAQKGLKSPSKYTALVKTLKANQLNDDTVRMVADLPSAYPYTPIFLDNPPRMVIRVAERADLLPPVEVEEPPTPRPPAKDSSKAAATTPSKATPTKTTPSKTTPSKTSPTKPAKGPKDSMARQLGLGIRLVAIDAGHGGKDGGAAGNGYKEKDITLKVAKMLSQKVQKRLGLGVIMTREKDIFVTLDRRTKTARDKKADLFISIHVNANDLAKVEGLETYILNFTSDPSAMAVAARENASFEKTMSEMSDLIQLIAKNTKVAESRVLAKSLHSGALASLRSQHKIRDLGVKEAAFIVLANVEVPAILVEIGFITNKNEADRLNQEAYLELLTDGLCQGLKSYLDGLP